MIQGHPYFFIKEVAQEILEPLGLVEVDKKLEPDVFGGAYSTFSDGKRNIQIIWDGKDGMGYARSFQNKEWEDIRVYLTEEDMESQEMNEGKIADFRALLRKVVS